MPGEITYNHCGCCSDHVTVLARRGSTYPQFESDMTKTILALCAASLAFAGPEDVKIDSGYLKGAVNGNVVS